MDLKTQKLPKNLIEIIALLAPEEMAEFNNEALKELTQNIQIPGFRPGKAPLEMVREKIGEIKILERAAEIAINKIYSEILVKENLNPAGPPKIEVLKLAPGNPFQFKLTLALVPKVELGDYKKIKVRRKKIIVPETDIDKALKSLQDMRRKESLANRESQIGDRLDIDLEMFLDKVPLENGRVKNLSVELGLDYYIPGLTENLKGLKMGEEKEFSLTYPAAHYDKKLAGKKIDFKARINNIYQIDLPALDDKFAEDLGAKNLGDLKTHIQKNLLAEANNKEDKRLELEILEELIQESRFEEIPEILIEHELDKMLIELKNAVNEEGPINKNEGEENDKFTKYLESIKKTENSLRKEMVPQAEKRIKTALAVRQLAQEEKIEASVEEVKKEIEKISDLYKDNKEILENFKTESGEIYLKNLLTNRKVIEWLKNQLNK